MLKNIASIQTGIYAKSDVHGNAIYLHARYFNESGQLDKNVIYDIYVDTRLSKHLLKDGDILFMAKGFKNAAIVYSESMGPAVASSSFFVIRVAPQLLPGYAAWYINHPNTQKILKGKARGSSLPSISIRTLEELEINIPDIKTQQDILIIQGFRTREKQLIEEIEALKEQYIQQELLLITKKNRI